LTVHPGVGVALADWLDDMADRASSGNDVPALRGLGLEPALAVADAILQIAREVEWPEATNVDVQSGEGHDHA
jgi:hypothetical protein